MSKKLLKPRVEPITETDVGQRLQQPDEQRRYAHIMEEARQAVQAEIRFVERSERLTHEDFAVRINARADDLK
jgi:DNA-binding transcriptional regulator YiaG